MSGTQRTIHDHIYPFADVLVIIHNIRMMGVTDFCIAARINPYFRIAMGFALLYDKRFREMVDG